VLRVGLRSASNDLDANSNAVFRVNGRRILIRGGGWAPDLLQRMDPRRHRRMLRLTRDLGLNAIRLEGKLQDDDLFEQCDAMGIMVLPGICCCDAWQSWDVWTPNTHQVAAASLRSQVKRLRRFPSVVTFLYSSDELPPPEVERAYLQIFQSERWQTGLISSAGYKHSPLTGYSGELLTYLYHL
jgi:exo-1,4-beta-D-glucosaminidase